MNYLECKKVEVIGYKGVVGGATYELMRRLGHNVSGVDIGDGPGHLRPNCDFYLVCTPEEAVEEVVNNLIEKRWLASLSEPLVVIRSTTPIGTLEKLMTKYNIHLCHWPEHLREATALWDCYFPWFVSIGQCCEEHGRLLEMLLKPIGVHIIKCDVTTSEASKYAINNFKAVVISFWNEFYMMSRAIGFNAHLAARIASNDPVISTYGTIMGKAYGGKCLPKDLQAMVRMSEEAGCDPLLLKAAEEVNKGVKELYGESDIRTG